MALEDQMAAPAPAQEAQQPPQGETLNDAEETDLELAMLLSMKLIDEGGLEVIDSAIAESKDPGQVIGQFLMQLVSQLGESVQFSPRIWLAKDGWVEQISDYLQEEYDVPRDVMDRAEMYIGSTSQKMAQGGAQDPSAGAPPAAPQPAPQGGMV